MEMLYKKQGKDDGFF